MCSPVSRVTACIAILIALVTVYGPAASRTGRDRDRVLRTTRVGPQRIDALEGAHGHDEPDSTVVPAARVTDHASGGEGPGPTPAAIVTAGPALSRHPQEPGTPCRPVVHARAGAALDAHAPDRAPPTA